MLIQPQFEPFPYILIDDYYDADELASVMSEIAALRDYSIADGAAQDAARDPVTGVVLKTGSGLFLDRLFNDEFRPKSKILRVNRKIFHPAIVEVGKQLNVFYQHLQAVTCDYTLLNYYHDGEEYRAHQDAATLSAVCMFALGEFTGGDFEFVEQMHIIEFRHNRLVLFPGCVPHKAHSIKSSTGGYRASTAQFLNYVGGNHR